jgi:urease accessory protein
MALASSPDIARLRLLQLADSAFPSGAYTLSHGLETLVQTGIVADRVGVAEFIDVQLGAKLARSDLVALIAAHRVANASPELEPLGGAVSTSIADLFGNREAKVDQIVAIDARLTACRLAADDRRASTRVGRRLATEASRLVPSPALIEFLAAITEGRTPGNAAVAFGLAGSAFGLGARDTAFAAASSSVAGIAAAAVRLGLLGHGEAQRLIADAAPAIIDAVDVAEAGSWTELRPSAPQIEIALAAHETAVARQFAT